MAYCIERVNYNGYRCSCCRHDYPSTTWVSTPEEVLAALPTEFPVTDEDSDVGLVSVRVRDGDTGMYVAHSEISWPPARQRADPYKFTKWETMISEDAFPGHGTLKTEIIAGTRPGIPVESAWGNILADLAEQKRLLDIAEAEAAKAAAERKLAALRKQPG